MVSWLALLVTQEVGKKSRQNSLPNFENGVFEEVLFIFGLGANKKYPHFAHPISSHNTINHSQSMVTFTTCTTSTTNETT